VEHPVTEAVTGLDFVRAQIEIAQGKPLERRFREPFSDFSDAPGEKGSRNLFRGHAIECRIYAEDPDLGFLPSPGLITHLRAPSGPGIRDDSGAFAGWTVPTSYDPLISKVIAWAPDRAGAIARMVRALTEYELRGIRTTIGFCRWLLSTSGFGAGDFDTTTVDRVVGDYRKSVARQDVELEELVAVAAALYAQAEAMRPRPARRRATAGDSLWAKQARIDSLR
jgi:acetyl-CoA carboxylase biotin carboxylase subunit